MISSVKTEKILVTFNLTDEEIETLRYARNIIEEIYGSLPKFYEFDFADEAQKIEIHSNTGFINDLIYICNNFFDYLDPKDSRDWIKVDRKED